MSIVYRALVSGSLLAVLAANSAPAFAADADASDAAATSRPEIVVTARLEKTARTEQAAAINLVNIQAAETIAKYPDVNAAEALGRMSGVALSIDTGEGRYVNIRGLDGNLNGSTFGGATLLNTQPGLTYFNSTGRAVEFDTIPIGAIDRIVVTKTGLPDHDAEGLGGTIELSPRTAIGRDKLFFEGTLGEGYEPERKTTILNAEAVLGGGFGTNASGGKLVHVVLTQSQHNDARGFDDIEEGYSDSPGISVSAANPTGVKNEDKLFNALELRRYRYHRQRSSYSAEFDVTPNDNNRFFARFNLAGYTERVNRQRVLLGALDGTGQDANGNTVGTIATDPNNPNGFIATQALLKNTLRNNINTARNLMAQLGGEHHAGTVKFDWTASYVRATFDSPMDINSTFAGPANVTVAYDNITNPDFPVARATSANLADPAIYHLTKATNRVEYDKDEAFSYYGNVSLPVGLLDHDEFKVGGKVSFRHKYSLARSARLTTAGQPLSQFLGDGPFTGYYNGLYNIGFAANAQALAANFAPQIGAIPALGINDTQFDDHEDIYAGYAQYSGKIGDHLNVLAGVRVEHTKSSLGGLLTNTDKNGNTTTNFTRLPSSYTNVFPTVQLRYDFSKNLIARAIYSTGIARPGFNQTVLNGSIDSSGGPNATVGVVNGGNPALKPTTGNSFDLSLEYYLPHSGIISIGLFDKEFRNFVIQNNFIGPFSANGVSGNYTFLSFQNVSGAYARGIELTFVDKFTGLPAPFDGLGVDLNGSYVDSSVAIHHPTPTTSISGQLPGTFKYSGNGAIFYERGPIELRLSAQYESKVLFAVGSIAGDTGYAGISNDTYQDKRVTLDLAGAYQVTRNVKFYASVKNLTDAPLRFYEGTANRPIQREFYGPTYEAGVKVKL